MATSTLLEIVQSVLSSMNSDEVNSINDTVESTQVTLVAKEVYLDFMSQDEWPHLMRDGELDSLGDITRPNFLKIPASVYRVKQIKYNITDTGDLDTEYRFIEYLAPKDFIALTDGNKTSESNVDIITTSNSTELFVITDEHPRWWTTFDNSLVTFDAYKKTEDTTLQGSKSKCLFYELPTWVNSDTAIPDIDERFFPAYLADVKRTCHQYFRQQPSIIDEERTRRGVAMIRQNAERIESGDKRAKFGRRQVRTRRNTRR